MLTGRFPPSFGPGMGFGRRSVPRTGSGATIAALARPIVGRAAEVTLVSWASAGQRWEFPERDVYPLFKKKFPNVDVQIVAEPIADMLPKTAVAM